jgi:surface antigen
VLTEELGHHLDGLLNVVDTPGDEGRRFSLLLSKDLHVECSQSLALIANKDSVILELDGNHILAEQSSLANFGINFDSSNYLANRFSYTTASSGFFQCTTYAYGRALEKGLFSPNITIFKALERPEANGGVWDDYTGIQSRVSAVNSFIVWDPFTDGTGAEGHVGFVEDIKPDGSLVISEANYRKQNRNPSLAWSTETISPGSTRYSTAKFIPLTGGSSTPPPPSPPPSAPRLAIPIFDPQYYLATYADVRNAYGASNHNGARSHWLQYGINEGRRGSLVFDPKDYLQRYQDVANAYGAANYAGAISHWLEWGLKDGRRGSQEFDPIYYMAAHPDVEQAYGVKNFSGAISHYYQWGKPGGWYGAPSGSPTKMRFSFGTTSTTMQTSKRLLPMPTKKWRQLGIGISLASMKGEEDQPNSTRSSISQTIQT